MTTQRNALLLFSKPPVPGMVKTRLTAKHDGPFTEEQAANLFHRMVFDVLECCCQALDELDARNRAAREADPSVPEQVYDVFVSTTPHSSVQKMQEVFAESGQWPRELRFIEDRGRVFDDHFDDAFQQIFDAGYGTCVSVGGDIPIMPRDHVVRAYEWLHRFQGLYPEGGMVVAPCQACGTSLVGYTPECGMNHQGVYYNMSGRPALQAYLDKAAELGVHMALLDAVPDVDNMEDLAHTLTVINALDAVAEDTGLFVPWRTRDWIRALGLTVSTPPNRNFDSREGIDE